MNIKQRVIVLYGGKSVEHKVSVRSAKNIVENINKSLFEPVLIGIDEEGNWFYQENFSAGISAGVPITMHLQQNKEVFYRLDNRQSLGPVDIVFPVLHGNDGEDGSIQGIFKTLDIPIVGTGVIGSAMSMNKLVAKKLLIEAGIPVSRYLHYTWEEKDTIRFQHVTSHLGLPVFIKPVSSGSSVGVSKIRNEQEFTDAVGDTFQYDNEVLFEECITGRELECAVMGNLNPVVSLPGEVIVAGHHDFYSFDAKYVDDQGATTEMPARLPADIILKAQETVIKTYKILKCEDYSRIDFFLTANNDIIINEVNTIPGFTNISMFPQLWKLAGISYGDLITRLINEALDKHTRNQRIKRNYESGLT